MKNLISKTTNILILAALLLIIIGPYHAYAASVTSFSDTLTRDKASTAGNQDISFVTPTGIATGATLILTYNNSTSINASLTFTDIDLLDNGTNVTLAAAPSGTTWGVVRTSATVITFTNGSTAVTAGHTVRIKIGTNAVNQTTGVFQITNGPAGTTTLVLSGTFGDTGTNSTSIVDDDQVTISATVNETITFDIDTATTDTDTNSPYTVALGALTTAAASNSDESAINSIWLNLATNAGGGANVTVLSANGALKSTAVPGDSIPSATATMAPGVANYGICVKTATATTGALTKASPFNGATCTTGHVDTVGALTTSPQNIITSTAPVNAGRVEIIVAAENSSVTPAHTDYSDTQTYIATGTF